MYIEILNTKLNCKGQQFALTTTARSTPLRKLFWSVMVVNVW